ncbi:MAG: hypothetical protein ACHQ1D_02990 [Nitrososphaerales archaeon]
MAVIPINLVFDINVPGQNEDNSLPRICRLKCGNTLAQVVTAGFLNPIIAAQGLTLYKSDFVFVAAFDGNQIYKPVIGVNGVITLTLLP